MTVINHRKPELCESFGTDGELLETQLLLKFPSAWLPALGVGLKNVPEPQGCASRSVGAMPRRGCAVKKMQKRGQEATQ